MRKRPNNPKYWAINAIQETFYLDKYDISDKQIEEMKAAAKKFINEIEKIIVKSKEGHK